MGCVFTDTAIRCASFKTDTDTGYGYGHEYGMDTVAAQNCYLLFIADHESCLSGVRWREQTG